jgi:hypothetical protein
MDTVDKVEEVIAVKKRGRPAKKQDPATPMGSYIAEEAKKARAKKSENKVVEKYYELCNGKLSLCKKIASGTVFKTYVGSTSDKKDGEKIKVFIKKLEEEKRLRVKI